MLFFKGTMWVSMFYLYRLRIEDSLGRAVSLLLAFLTLALLLRP
jgi:hypothetical protein